MAKSVINIDRKNSKKILEDLKKKRKKTEYVSTSGAQGQANTRSASTTSKNRSSSSVQKSDNKPTRQTSSKREEIANKHKGESYKIGEGYKKRTTDTYTYGKKEEPKKTYNYLEMVNPTEYKRQQEKARPKYQARYGNDKVTQAERRVEAAETALSNYKDDTNKIVNGFKSVKNTYGTGQSWSDYVKQSSDQKKTLDIRKGKEKQLQKNVDAALENFKKKEVEHVTEVKALNEQVKATNKKEYNRLKEVGKSKLTQEDFDKIFKQANGDYRASIELDTFRWQELQDLINERSQEYTDDLNAGQMTDPNYKGNPELLREVNKAQAAFNAYKNKTTLYAWCKKNGLLDDLEAMLGQENVNKKAVLREFERMVNESQTKENERQLQAIFSPEAFSEEGIKKQSKYNQELAKTFGLVNNDIYRRVALWGAQVMGNTTMGTQEGLRTLMQNYMKSYQNANSDISDRDYRPDPNSGAFSYQKLMNNVRTMYTDGVDEKTALFMNLGVEAMNMILGQQSLGGLYTTTMGIQAGGQQAYDTIEKGGTYEQAAITGTIAGAAAAIIEQLSIDKIFSAWDNVALTSGIKEVIKAFGISATSEGLEEVAEEVVNMVADMAVMKDKNDIALYLQEYQDAHPNSLESERNMAVAQYIWSRIGQSFAGGALLGGIFGGAVASQADGSPIIETRQQHKDMEIRGRAIRAGKANDAMANMLTVPQGQENIEEGRTISKDERKLRKDAATTAPTSEAGKMLQKIMDKEAAGEEVTDYEIGKLDDLTNKELRRQKILQAASDGQLRSNELDKQTRRVLYDPRNAEWTAETLTLYEDGKTPLINSEMTPKQIKSVVDAELDNRANDKVDTLMGESFLENGVTEASLSDGARAKVYSEEWLAEHGIFLEAGETPASAVKRAREAHIKENNMRSVDDYAQEDIDTYDPMTGKKNGTTKLKDNIYQTYKGIEDKGLRVVISDGVKGNGFATPDTIVISSKIANSEEGVKFAMSHELVHEAETSKHYKGILESARDFIENERGLDWYDYVEALRQNRADKYGEYLSHAGAEAEAVANFVGEHAFGSIEELKKFVESNRTAAGRIRNWLISKMDLNDDINNKYVRRAYEKFRRAFAETSGDDADKRFEKLRTLNGVLQQNSWRDPDDVRNVPSVANAMKLYNLTDAKELINDMNDAAANIKQVYADMPEKAEEMLKSAQKHVASMTTEKLKKALKTGSSRIAVFDSIENQQDIIQELAVERVEKAGEYFVPVIQKLVNTSKSKYKAYEKSSLLSSALNVGNERETNKAAVYNDLLKFFNDPESVDSVDLLGRILHDLDNSDTDHRGLFAREVERYVDSKYMASIDELQVARLNSEDEVLGYIPIGKAMTIAAIHEAMIDTNEYIQMPMEKVIKAYNNAVKSGNTNLAAYINMAMQIKNGFDEHGYHGSDHFGFISNEFDPRVKLDNHSFGGPMFSASNVDTANSYITKSSNFAIDIVQSPDDDFDEIKSEADWVLTEEAKFFYKDDEDSKQLYSLATEYHEKIMNAKTRDELIALVNEYDNAIKKIDPSLQGIEKWLPINDVGIYDFAVNTDNFLEIVPASKSWKLLGYIYDGKIYNKTREVGELARKLGYDGVVIRDIYDYGPSASTGANMMAAGTSDIFIDLHGGRYKFATPVLREGETYVPIEKRYQKTKSDGTPYNNFQRSVDDSDADIMEQYDNIQDGKDSMDILLGKSSMDTLVDHWEPTLPPEVQEDIDLRRRVRLMNEYKIRNSYLHASGNEEVDAEKDSEAMMRWSKFKNATGVPPMLTADGWLDYGYTIAPDAQPIKTMELLVYKDGKWVMEKDVPVYAIKFEKKNVNKHITSRLYMPIEVFARSKHGKPILSKDSPVIKAKSNEMIKREVINRGEMTEQEWNDFVREHGFAPYADEGTWKALATHSDPKIVTERPYTELVATFRKLKTMSPKMIDGVKKLKTLMSAYPESKKYQWYLDVADALSTIQKEYNAMAGTRKGDVAEGEPSDIEVSHRILDFLERINTVTAKRTVGKYVEPMYHTTDVIEESRARQAEQRDPNSKLAQDVNSRMAQDSSKTNRDTKMSLPVYVKLWKGRGETLRLEGTPTYFFDETQSIQTGKTSVYREFYSDESKTDMLKEMRAGLGDMMTVRIIATKSKIRELGFNPVKVMAYLDGLEADPSSFNIHDNTIASDEELESQDKLDIMTDNERAGSTFELLVRDADSLVKDFIVSGVIEQTGKKVKFSSHPGARIQQVLDAFGSKLDLHFIGNAESIVNQLAKTKDVAKFFNKMISDTRFVRVGPEQNKNGRVLKGQLTPEEIAQLSTKDQLYHLNNEGWKDKHYKARHININNMIQAIIDAKATVGKKQLGWKTVNGEPVVGEVNAETAKIMLNVMQQKHMNAFDTPAEYKKKGFRIKEKEKGKPLAKSVKQIIFDPKTKKWGYTDSPVYGYWQVEAIPAKETAAATIDENEEDLYIKHVQDVQKSIRTMFEEAEKAKAVADEIRARLEEKYLPNGYPVEPSETDKALGFNESRNWNIPGSKNSYWAGRASIGGYGQIFGPLSEAQIDYIKKQYGEDVFEIREMVDKLFDATAKEATLSGAAVRAALDLDESIAKRRKKTGREYNIGQSSYNDSFESEFGISLEGLDEAEAERIRGFYTNIEEASGNLTVNEDPEKRKELLDKAIKEIRAKKQGAVQNEDDAAKQIAYAWKEVNNSISYIRHRIHSDELDYRIQQLISHMQQMPTKDVARWANSGYEIVQDLRDQFNSMFKKGRNYGRLSGEHRKEFNTAVIRLQEQFMSVLNREKAAAKDQPAQKMKVLKKNVRPMWKRIDAYAKELNKLGIAEVDDTIAKLRDRMSDIQSKKEWSKDVAILLGNLRGHLKTLDAQQAKFIKEQIKKGIPESSINNPYWYKSKELERSIRLLEDYVYSTMGVNSARIRKQIAVNERMAKSMEAKANSDAYYAEKDKAKSAPAAPEGEITPLRDVVRTKKSKRKPVKAENRETLTQLRKTAERKIMDSFQAWNDASDAAIAAEERVLQQIKEAESNGVTKTPDIMKPQKLRNIRYMADGTRRAKQVALQMIGHDIFDQTAYQRDFKGDFIYDDNGNKAKSLYAIFEPLRKIEHKFPEAKFHLNMYLRLKDHVERMNNKRGGTLPSQVKPGKYMSVKEAEEIIAMYEAKDSPYSWVLPIANDVWFYSRNMLKWAYDSGMISYEDYTNILDKHQHYIPAYVDSNAEIPQRGSLNNQAVKSSRKIDKFLPLLPVDEALSMQTLSYVMKGTRNALVNALADAYEQYGEYLTDYVSGMDVKQDSTDLVPIDGVDVLDKVYHFDYEDKTGSVDTISFYRDGHKASMKVSRPILEGYLEIGRGMSPWENLKIVKGTRALGTFFRNSVTNYNPTFIGTNAMKDFGDAIFYSQNPAKFAKNYAKGFARVKQNHELWQIYKANGGFNSSFFELDKDFDHPRTKLRRYTIDMIEKANVLIEQMPRFAEFVTTLEMHNCLDKNGNVIEGTITPDILAEAMSASAEITVNFGKFGTHTKGINRNLVPFFNASLQGMGKWARLFETKGGRAWGNLAIKAGLLGFLPGLLNGLLYKDDEEYNHFSDFIRDNNFMFKWIDGEWYAIPYGRLMSVLKGLGQRTVRGAMGLEVDWGSWLELIETNVAPANIATDNIFSPIIRTLNNETWSGAKIDSAKDLKKPASERYDSKTSEIFKWIGKLTNQSPKRIQELFTSYTGIVGDFVTTLTNNDNDMPWDKMGQKFHKDPVYSNDYGSMYTDYKEDLKTAVDYEGESEVPSVLKLKQTFFNKKSQGIWDIYEQLDELDQKGKDIPDHDKKEKVLRTSLTAMYGSVMTATEAFETELRKHYKVDENAPEEIQKRQAENAYTETIYALYGVEEAIKAAGVNDERLRKIRGTGMSLESYYKYLMLTKSGTKYMSLDDDGEVQHYTTAEKKKIALNMGLGDEDLRRLYRFEFEKNNKRENTITYAVEQGITPKEYIKTGMSFSEIDEDDSIEEKGIAKKQWLLDNFKDEEKLQKIYDMKLSSDSTKELNTIDYAVDHGVRASKYIQREIERAGEHGDLSGEFNTDYYIEDGVLVEFQNPDYTDGSKLIKAAHALVNNGYTEREIEYFYQREYPNDDKFVWITSAGVSAKEYVKYREDTALCVADKDENGKTIPNSKKDKIYAILNNSNLDKTKKLLLFMRTNALTEDQYIQVFNYINSLNITPDEKLALAKGLGFKIEGRKVYMKKAS